MSPAPSLTPTAPAALEPTGATALEPTAADGVSIDYNVSVPSISEAEAVEAVVETATPADVDDAVETAATEVATETGTTITLVESIATEEVSAVEIAADPPGTPGDDGDDAPTLGLSETDNDGAGGDGGDGGGGSGGGGGGGADAAAAGGAAAGGLLLLALGMGLYVYRRRSSKAPAAAEDDVERAISKQLAVPDLLPLHALAPEDVAAWLRRQDLPGDVDGLCAAVVKRDINGATLRDADDASLKGLGATLGLRKAVLKLLRAEPPAPRRADEPPPPPPLPPPPPPGLLGRI